MRGQEEQLFRGLTVAPTKPPYRLSGSRAGTPVNHERIDSNHTGHTNVRMFGYRLPTHLSVILGGRGLWGAATILLPDNATAFSPIRCGVSIEVKTAVGPIVHLPHAVMG